MFWSIRKRPLILLPISRRSSGEWWIGSSPDSASTRLQPSQFPSDIIGLALLYSGGTVPDFNWLLYYAFAPIPECLIVCVYCTLLVFQCQGQVKMYDYFVIESRCLWLLLLNVMVELLFHSESYNSRDRFAGPFLAKWIALIYNEWR